MKGIDISNHNGNIDFLKVKKEGIEVVIIKATEGVNWIDPNLEVYYNSALKVGLAIGFYHFMSEKTSPSKQAEDFFSAIKGKNYKVIPCLDIETNNYGRTSREITDRCLEFARKLKELSNQECIIYTGGYFGRDNLDSRIKHYKAWIAHYGVSVPMNTGFHNVVGHQYTENGKISGINGNVDLNNFNEGIFINDNVQAFGKIAELQGLCNSILGTDLKIDNLWGPKTNDAVKRLPLCGLPYVQRELTTWVQLRLGLVPKDGIFGIRTEREVKAWQRKNGLKVDGIVGYNTYKSLATA